MSDRKFIRLILFTLLIACNKPTDPPMDISGLTMGTTYSITLPTAYEEKRKELDMGISSILDDINQKMSTYISDSEISVINKSVGNEWLPISKELYLVMQSAQRISEQTNGAFDMTVGALVNLWGFGPIPSPVSIPDPDKLEMMLDTSGYTLVYLRSNPYAFKKEHSDTYIDLSGIAKGYAVDQISLYLEQHDIDNYLVDIGGEVKAKGQNGLDQTWRIGIEKPDINSREIQQIIKLENMAMATSGDYRNYFIIEDVRYSHTINPATGWPVEHFDSSVTVLNESTMIADALATALVVMGPEKGLSYAESQGIPALFIVIIGDQSTEHYTNAFMPYLIK